jgi:hypothetical protein
MTAEFDWNPSICDNKIDDLENVMMQMTLTFLMESVWEVQVSNRCHHNTQYEPDFFEAADFLDYDDLDVDFLDLSQPDNGLSVPLFCLSSFPLLTHTVSKWIK